jgi:hypothetical protein
MKVVIDLIEDIRESINNNESYSIAGMLLKEDANNKKLIKKECDRVELVNIETI